MTDQEMIEFANRRVQATLMEFRTAVTLMTRVIQLSPTMGNYLAAIDTRLAGIIDLIADHEAAKANKTAEEPNP